MTRYSVHGIVKTSIVSAFTFTAALIWRDVFVDGIEIFFPQEVLLYKFLGALIVTILVVIAIFLTLKTDREVDKIIKGIEAMNRKKRKKILQEIKKAADKKKQEELKKIEDKKKQEELKAQEKRIDEERKILDGLKKSGKKRVSKKQ